jgi:hypothetical protein
VSTTPQIEPFVAGNIYAYDGANRIYFSIGNTQRCYYLDITTSTIHGAGLYPYIVGGVVLGNRMEIIKTSDNLKYLWLNRNSNLECFRQMLFY